MRPAAIVAIGWHWQSWITSAYMHSRTRCCQFFGKKCIVVGKLKYFVTDLLLKSSHKRLTMIVRIAACKVCNSSYVCLGARAGFYQNKTFHINCFAPRPAWIIPCSTVPFNVRSKNGWLIGLSIPVGIPQGAGEHGIQWTKSRSHFICLNVIWAVVVPLRIIQIPHKKSTWFSSWSFW